MLGNGQYLQNTRWQDQRIKAKCEKKIRQLCAWILCHKRYEVEVVVWGLTMELDPDLLDQTSTYIDKNVSKFVISLPAEW